VCVLSSLFPACLLFCSEHASRIRSANQRPGAGGCGGLSLSPTTTPTAGRLIANAAPAGVPPLTAVTCHDRPPPTPGARRSLTRSPRHGHGQSDRLPDLRQAKPRQATAGGWRARTYYTHTPTHCTHGARGEGSPRPIVAGRWRAAGLSVVPLVETWSGREAWPGGIGMLARIGVGRGRLRGLTRPTRRNALERPRAAGGF
jgi:hypothetical protein